MRRKKIYLFIITNFLKKKKKYIPDECDNDDIVIDEDKREKFLLYMNGVLLPKIFELFHSIGQKQDLETITQYQVTSTSFFPLKNSKKYIYINEINIFIPIIF